MTSPPARNAAAKRAQSQIPNQANGLSFQNACASLLCIVAKRGELAPLAIAPQILACLIASSAYAQSVATGQNVPNVQANSITQSLPTVDRLPAFECQPFECQPFEPCTAFHGVTAVSGCLPAESICLPAQENCSSVVGLPTVSASRSSGSIHATRATRATEPAAISIGEDASDQDEQLLLRDFRPAQQLKATEHLKTEAKFPVVDVHTHFHYKLRSSEQALDDFVSVMDRNKIALCASLDGKLGGQLEEHIRFLWSRYPNRFVIFANVDWQGDGVDDDPASWSCHRPGFANRTAQELEAAVEMGVSGLKVFKRFGLGYQNPDGSLIEIDDPRFDPIWDACGRLGIPVIIHSADPAAFFDPINETNERWEELSRHPDWSFYGDRFPSRKDLLDARNRLIGRHAETQFIGAHIANNSEDLAEVDRWLETYPNLWIETASRIAELGRQPFTAREFLMRHADRVLFGTDGPWSEKRLQINWRFFETHDESFDYSEKVPPPQGMWTIYGVDLPDDVLRKLYYQNASRLIPGVKERVEAFQQSQLVPASK